MDSQIEVFKKCKQTKVARDANGNNALSVRRRLAPFHCPSKAKVNQHGQKQHHDESDFAPRIKNHTCHQ